MNFSLLFAHIAYLVLTYPYRMKENVTEEKNANTRQNSSLMSLSLSYPHSPKVSTAFSQ